MAKVNLARKLENVPEKDRVQIEKAQEMLGPDPERMGFVKNLFWGRIREELLLPWPETPPDEVARCDQLLAEVDAYLRHEHSAIEVDRSQHLPDSVFRRLFELGVMGMIIPVEHGGGGFGITSYNRVLERIGRTCGSTAVMVSAHQSIGCGAIALFGSEAQKDRWLPRMARDTVSAFCLSEPGVGCDAGAQETTCELSEDGEHYILNGEKKWATSAAMAGMLTVMAKQRLTDPATGAAKGRITALIVTPDMEGVDIFSRNRAKCGIRGTWQARIRFTNVRVPRANLLHEEGRGLNVALECLNVGRCTLAAGMVGAGRAAHEQAVKWAQHRHQFDRPIAEFEQIQGYIAEMAALCYAMDAVLYMTTGILDRHDEDIMLETAICKVFCSEMGFRCADHAMQIMGGEGYMTENELERIWRDSRINQIVEGANEVMHSFVFAYGSKQLGEFMLGVRERPTANFGAAFSIAAELYLGLKPGAPSVTALHPSLSGHARRLERHVRDFAHQVKVMFRDHREALITRQMIQARLSWAVTWIHVLACSLSRHDRSIRHGGADNGALERERAVVDHLCALGAHAIDDNLRALRRNTDATLHAAADAAMTEVASLPNEDYAIPEWTPEPGMRGSGRRADQTHIMQFGAGVLPVTTDSAP